MSSLSSPLNSLDTFRRNESNAPLVRASPFEYKASIGGNVFRRTYNLGGQQGWVNPEATAPGDHISKYCIDLTEQAKQGKLDPVIGRDEVIRRTLQVSFAGNF